MKRLVVPVCLLLLLTFSFVAAQGPVPQSELDFVQKMRENGYARYALEYLKKLKTRYKNDRKLDLEIVRAQLAEAREAPEAAKRVALLNEVRKALQKFVDDNPKHPETKNARFQIIQVAAEQGRAQLRYANSMNPDDSARNAEYTDARMAINQAKSQLAAKLKEFKDEQLEQAKLELAKLALDEVATLVTPTTRARRIPKLSDARTKLEELIGELPDDSARRYVALAYAGHAYSLSSIKDQAEKYFDQVLKSDLPNDSDGKRLASYFFIMHKFKQQRAKNVPDPTSIPELMDLTGRWLGYFGSSGVEERFGVLYVRGSQQYYTGQRNKTVQARLWTDAKSSLSQVEAHENDFTGRAVKLKLEIMFNEGAFAKDVAKLVVFEDLYYRGVYEAQRLNDLIAKDKEIESLKEDDPKRAQHEKDKDAKRADVITLFTRAVERAKGRAVIERNLNAARFLLTAYQSAAGETLFRKSLTLYGKEELPSALKTWLEAKEHLKKTYSSGKSFVDASPQSSRAPQSSMYAASALDRLIDRGYALHVDLLQKTNDEQRVEKQKVLLAEQDDNRKKRVSLCQMMLKQYEGKEAAEYAKYHVIRYLIDEDKESEALKYPGDMTWYLLGKKKQEQEKLNRAVTYLRKVSPKYPDYYNTQYFIATMCLSLAEKGEKLEDKSDPRTIAIETLKKYPLPPADAPGEPHVYWSYGKSRLISLLYQDKKLEDVEKLGREFLRQLKNLPGGLLKDEVRDEVRNGVITFLVYQVYTKVAERYQKAKYQEVTEALAPMLTQLKDASSDERAYVTAKNWEMIGALMKPGFLAYLQSGQIKKAEEVQAQWKELLAEAKAKAVEAAEKKAQKNMLDVEQVKKQVLQEWAARDLKASDLLKQVITVMKEQVGLLKKINDDKQLETTISNFTAYLTKFEDDVVKDLTMARYVALSYESIERHQKAIDLLTKVLKPARKPDEKKDAANFKRWINLELLLVREYRLLAVDGEKKKNKKQYEDSINEAYKRIQQIRKERDKDLLAIKEELEVLIVKKLYASAANRAYALVQELKQFIRKKPAVRPHYFDAYFALIRAYYFYSRTADKLAERQKALISTAKLLIKLEGILTDEVENPKERKIYKQRFADFLEEHDDLKSEVEKLR